MVKMGQKAKEVDFGNQFQFYKYLSSFYNENKPRIWRSYKDLTKKILKYNDKRENPSAFLRKPQFEALEMYVFLKEFLDNKQMSEIFNEWRHKEGKFGEMDYLRGGKLKAGQTTFFDTAAEDHEVYFKHLQKFSAEYPNYIFSLAMGLGKTLLMATCIFYEFLLSNKYPKDSRYCQNALIFAPDLTVLQSLSEIATFDKSLVIPPEYVGVLDANLRIHHLTESSTLNTLDSSTFNLIISNTQKIILKKKGKEISAGEKVFLQTKLSYNPSLDDIISSVYGEGTTSSDIHDNQKFAKLARLPQIGIYVDEAHHMFGANLQKALRGNKDNTSLRNTIDVLSKYLRQEQNKIIKAGKPPVTSGIVGCYNFTGTPYVENSVLPEVVYSYGLQESIQHEYLKRADVQKYENVKSSEFLREVITKFWERYGGKTYEGLTPKLAIFGAKIDEVINEIKPEVENILTDLEIPISKILVNVGDTKEGKRYTTDEDIGLFNHLDVAEHQGNDKQFILLVNKGREGWNCRSLFGVALYRKPDKSKVFVLQATMRCLRKITEEQQTASVFLSEENFDTLKDELDKNFRVNIEDLKNLESDEKVKEKCKVRVIPPPRKIKVKVVRHKYTCSEREKPDQVSFNLKNCDFSRYEAKTYTKELGSMGSVKEAVILDVKQPLSFNKMHLVFEISRYLNMKPTRISELLDQAEDKVEDVLAAVNKYNAVLYDVIIPNIFNAVYEVTSEKVTEEKTLVLLREPKNSEYYEFSAKPMLVVRESDSDVQKYVQKSFHADTYCFDSKPEKECFWQYLQSPKVKKVYFTGMFTSGQGDLAIPYIDPITKALRNYYPDFLAEMEDGTYQIIEVKGDNMIDDSVVLEKKAAAEEMATESKMEYIIYKGNDIMKMNVLGDNTLFD